MVLYSVWLSIQCLFYCTASIIVKQAYVVGFVVRYVVGLRSRLYCFVVWLAKLRSSIAKELFSDLWTVYKRTMIYHSPLHMQYVTL